MRERFKYISVTIIYQLITIGDLFVENCSKARAFPHT